MVTVAHNRWLALPSGTLSPLQITTASIPGASTGTAYSTTIAATGGLAPYTWSVFSALPNTGGWLSINASTGVLSGTPTTAETEVIVIQVQDSKGTKASAYYLLSVSGSSVAAPLVLYTDITDGPITGGENNKGCYLSVFGLNFGSFADWGVRNHLLIGGVEVDNYRSLQRAVTNGAVTEGPGIFGIQCLRVQVGALGSPTLGTPLAITMTASGVAASNQTSSGFLLDLDGNQIQFTPVNGSIFFVSLTGSDQAGFATPPTGTQGTIANPLRHVQTFNSGTSQFGAALWGNASGSITTANRVAPGTHVYMRAGEYGGDQTFNASFCDFFRLTGLAPSAATLSGSIVITSYPGAAGANTPEVVTINTLAGSAGGFNFADTARSSETTPYGTVGWSSYITIANLLIHGPTTTFSTNGAAGCPVNWQTQALGSRVVNCDLAFAPTSGGPTSGGMGGFATNGRRLGNYVHDIQDPSGAQQNHGFYIGENTGSSNPAAVGELHSISAYNFMIRCQGGQGIMMRGAYQTETLPYCSIHHNWIQGPGKFCIELFDQRDRANVWSNVLIGETIAGNATTTGTQAGFVVGSDNVTATNGIYFGYNTVIGVVNHYAMYYCLGGVNTGSALLEGNIFRQASSGGIPPFGTWLLLNTGGLTATLQGNCWLDATGNSANPSDATGIFADPLLTSVVSPYNLSPSASSTVPNKGHTPPTVSIVALDFLFQARPQGTNTKWALGSIERTGG